MSSITFKNEAWTIATQPTHKVIAVRGRFMDIVGYFIARNPSEVEIAMEVFDAEYGNHYDRLMATPVTAEVVRQDPSMIRVIPTNMLRKVS